MSFEIFHQKNPFSKVQYFITIVVLCFLSNTNGAFFCSKNMIQAYQELTEINNRRSYSPPPIISFGKIEGETIGAVASLSACLTTRGIGLLQWTGVRHQSFNTYFNQHNGAWTSAQSQLNFLATEPQWTTARSCFASSRDIDDAWDNAQATAGSYWKCAATWIGWGTLGNRIQYAGEYLAKL